MDRVSAAVTGFECDSVGSNLHQLALMTALRIALTETEQDSDGDQAMSDDDVRLDAIMNTDVREVMHKALLFSNSATVEADIEILYFIKLEVIWAFIDFSCGSNTIIEYLVQEVELPSADC